MREIEVEKKTGADPNQIRPYFDFRKNNGWLISQENPVLFPR